MASAVLPWHSLKTRITLTSLAIFVASLWGLSFYAAHALREDVQRQLGEQQFSTASLVAAQVDRELSIRLDALITVAKLSGSAMQEGGAVVQAMIEQQSILQAQFSGGIYVTGIDGTVIADLPLPAQRIGVNYMDRDYIATPLRNGKATIGSPVIGKRARTPVFVMAAPIRDSRGKVIGAIAGVTNLGMPNFLDEITHGSYGQTGGYVLVARQHRLVVTATDKRRIMTTLPAPGVNPLIDNFVEGFEGTSIVVNPQGVEVLASAKGIPVAAWYLLASLPTAEAFSPIHEMQQRMLMATVILTLLAGGFTWWALRRQLSPILVTANFLAGMADASQPLQTLPIGQKDEIGYLISGFNRLIDTLGQRETDLRESEERFRALHDASFGGISIHENGIILECNQSLADLTGYSVDELIGMDGLDLIAPECRQEVIHHIATGFEQVYDAEGLCKDGTRFPLSIQGKNIRYKGRSVRVTEFRDITERKRAVEELRYSEENLAITLHSIGDAVIATDANGLVTRMNPTAERLTGWPLADACQHPLSEVFHIVNADTREIVVNPVQLVMTHGQVVGLANHTLLLSRTGHEFQIADSAAPIRNGKNEIVGVVLVFSDVTEKYQTQDALYEAQTILQAALDQSPAGIVIADAPDGALRFVNDSALSIRGQDRASVEYGVSMEHMFSHCQLFDLDGRLLRIEEIPLARAILFGESGNREFKVGGQDNCERIVMSKAAPIKNKSGEIIAGISISLDITESKMAEDEIKRLAFYDQLTGLPNRRLLIDRLKQALAMRSRHHRGGALLFIDLDNFKALNDTLGHDIGDLLLQQVSRRLIDSVREGDTVSRFGGDEFVVMLEGLSENADEVATQTEAVGEKIIGILSKPFQLASYAHHCTASIGITLVDSQTDVEELLKRADLAMYQAKAAGRNTLRFFDPAMQALVTAHAALEADLRVAILKQQFVLYYQAQVDSSGRTLGAEVLLHWQHPDRGLVSPVEFIPLTEDTGLISPIGQWVLETSCDQLAIWARRAEFAHLTVAVNVSARQFHHRDFVAQVLAALARSGARPQRLKLELTEGLLLDDVDDVIAKMTTLKAHGICFSLDDFGTGYSSLSYLKRLPLDQLKIDQSFVQDVLSDPNDAAIVRTILTLGQSLGLQVIAEGVETAEQRDFLERNGCLSYQGFYFSRPLRLEDFEQYVQHVSSGCKLIQASD